MAQILAHRALSNHLSKSFVGLSLLLMTSTVFAAGFQIQEQNVTNLGTAYAGTAAWAADASSAFYNAAALTHIKDKQMVASGVLILGNFDFDATVSNLPAAPATAVPGPQNDDPGGPALVPGLHYAARLNDSLVFGLSVTAPFGLKTDYSESKVLRYVATTSELRTIDIIPSLAWRATEWLSVAAGPDFMFADAFLDAKINVTDGTAGGDGFQRNRARDWAVGWHAGLLVDVGNTTRVGMQYRSKFSFGADGNSENLLPPALGGAYFVRKLHANVTLPETLVLSGYHELDRCWAIMADIAWTRWNRFKDLQLEFTPATNQDTVSHVNFKNAWRFALGTNFTYSPSWQFRAGVALDKTPVQDAYRTARIPDSNRVWLGLGLGYTLSESVHFDLGYSHIFFKDASLNDRGVHSVLNDTPVFPFNQVAGEFSSNANIFGMQVRYDFV